RDPGGGRDEWRLHLVPARRRALVSLRGFLRRGGGRHPPGGLCRGRWRGEFRNRGRLRFDRFHSAPRRPRDERNPGPGGLVRLRRPRVLEGGGRGKRPREAGGSARWRELGRVCIGLVSDGRSAYGELS